MLIALAQDLWTLAESINLETDVDDERVLHFVMRASYRARVAHELSRRIRAANEEKAVAT